MAPAHQESLVSLDPSSFNDKSALDLMPEHLGPDTYEPSTQHVSIETPQKLYNAQSVQELKPSDSGLHITSDTSGSIKVVKRQYDRHKEQIRIL